MKRFGICALTLGLLAAVQGGSLGQAKNPVVVMDTSMGKITIELFEAKAPITVKNFLKYVDDKHYEGTIFHRVIPTFMIQGGGMEPGLREKRSNAPIKNESTNGLSNERGTIAMARTNDPDSATAQFFINVDNNKALDRSAGNAGYAVFGKVIDGMDVVDKIRRVETGNRAVGPQQHQNVPVQDVVIRSVKRK